MQVFTLGYQSLSTQLYVQTLINAGIGLVIDVREHAWSQRPAFVKSNLRQTLNAAGIDYAHLRELGNQAIKLNKAKSSSECLHRYKK